MSVEPALQSRDELLQAYGRMALIRAFEEKAAELFLANRIPGFVQLYAGEEAVAAGVMAALRPDAWIASTHRGHGHSIAQLEKGMLGANSIVV